MGDFTLGCLLGQYDRAQSFDVASAAITDNVTQPGSWEARTNQASFYLNDGGAFPARVHSSQQSLRMDVFSQATQYPYVYGYDAANDAYARWFPQVTTHTLRCDAWISMFTAAESGVAAWVLGGSTKASRPIPRDYDGGEDYVRLETLTQSGGGAILARQPLVGLEHLSPGSATVLHIDDVLTQVDWITLHPGFDLREQARVVQSAHRTRSGKLYSYRWSKHFAYAVPLRFLADSHADLVNWWWENQLNLVLTLDTSDSESLRIVRITNDRQPIHSRVAPYDNLWSGTVHLESIDPGSLVF